MSTAPQQPPRLTTHHTPRHLTQHGTVVAFDDDLGYGDVQSAVDQHTYFFHCTQLSDGSRTIAPGAEVSFRVAAGRMGRWEAVDVVPLTAPTAARTTDASFPCPVCGAAVAGARGAYEICPRCGWEDDPVQSSDPGYPGGANTLSLNDARADWIRRQAR